MAKLSMQDKVWMAESDARCLSEAAVIAQDKKRMGAAAKAAGKMATEKQKEAKAMTQVAKKAPSSKPTAKAKKK